MTSHSGSACVTIFDSGWKKMEHNHKFGECHGSFHLRGLTRAVSKAGREYQNEKFLPSVVFEPGTLRSEHAKHCTTRFDIYRTLESFLPVWAF